MQVAFLGYPLMRPGSAFNVILEIVTLWRQKLRVRIDGAPTDGAERP
jgi:hypothetical protein